MTFPLDPIRKISRLRGVLGLCLLAGLVSGLLLRVQAQSAWTSVDINTTFPGATTEDGSSIAVQASGAGIAGDSDSFRFVYQAAAGDFEFSAKITEWQASTYRSRAGLMIRNSANPAAAYVAVMIQDNTGYRLQWRTNDGGSSSSNNLSAAVSLPVWLKLSKQGNTVSAFYSQDGQAWTSLFTPKTVSFDPDFPYGLAVTSSREGVYVQAGFTEITIPGAPLATATATSTLTPTATATDTPTATNMPTASDTHTPAPASTSTPTATATNTPIPTATHTPTATATDTPAASPTYTPTPTPTPAQPVISRFDPQEGPAGAYVRIFGSDLQQVTEVRFNGVLASFSHHPNLYLVAIVPEGTTTGPITVAGPGGSDASDTPFTVTYPPSISGYSPQEGPVGTLVTIQGEHFSGTREVVFTNDVPAEFVVVSDVEIQAVVPQGATSGPIYIISPNGSALTGTFTVIPPAEWTSLDINTRSPGSTLQNGSSLTVRGSGAGLWGSSDSFRFVYQPASADLEFSARISQWNYTTSRSKGGLIMRSSVDPGAAYVSVMLSSGSGYRLQWRTSDGAGSSANILSAPINLPVWLKLSKQGNTITAFYSPDGQAWTRISAPKTINLPPDYLYGMAVTASREGYYAQATFEEFQPPIGQPPLVSSFEPMTAHFSPAAAEIDIWGSAFSGATSVTFNGVPALSFSVVSDAHIRATVPSEGPLHGPLFVTTPFGSDISSQSFTYIWDHLFPAIASFSPTAGLPGATVTITGRNFTGATQVSFNGGLSHDFTVISDTTIQSVLPDLARSGRIYVTNPAGQGKSSGGFTVYTSDSPTRIDSFLPASAQAGETVAIYGRSFFSSAAAR